MTHAVSKKRMAAEDQIRNDTSEYLPNTIPVARNRTGLSIGTASFIHHKYINMLLIPYANEKGMVNQPSLLYTEKS
jgi:hypothetical protein